MYHLKEKVFPDFAISKNQIDRLTNYFGRFGKHSLKSYRIETMEEKNEVIHFKGDNITVSARLSDVCLFPDWIEELFEGEQRDYRDEVELPQEMIQTLDEFNWLLREEDKMKLETDRKVTLRFLEGQLVCSIKTQDRKLLSKTFHFEHGIRGEDINLRQML